MPEDTFTAPGIVGALRLSLDISSCSAIAERLAAHLGDGTVGYNTAPLDSASPWLTSREAAAYLKVGLSELQRLAAAGGIPHEQDAPGGKLYFHADDLDQWRRDGGRKAA